MIVQPRVENTFEVGSYCLVVEPTSGLLTCYTDILLLIDEPRIVWLLLVTKRFQIE